MSEFTWLLLDRIGIVTGLLAFLGTTFSASMWLRQILRERKMREPVPIRIVVEDGRRYELPIQPPRRIVTRAEVLGLLGMIPSRQLRFDWKYFLDAPFLQHVEEVYRGKRDALEISLTAEEFAQLDLPGQPL